MGGYCLVESFLFLSKSETESMAEGASSTSRVVTTAIGAQRYFGATIDGAANVGYSTKVFRATADSDARQQGGGG